MKAFVFVNDNGSAYNRFSKGEIPAQFVYGVSQLEKMGFEIKVAQGHILKDLFSFLIFKPDLFFMPFTKRKTIAYFILSKLFFFRTKFAGWMHLDIFLPPNSKAKKIIYQTFLFILERYIRSLSSIFFLSEKTMEEMITQRGLDRKKCHFIPWGGDKDFYAGFLKDKHSGNVICTGRENRDIMTVLTSVKDANVNLDIYTNDTALPDSYKNIHGEFKINKGRWEYKELLDKVSSSKCMIIPLKKEKINYCVGLSSLIEAISLGLPIIATYNPYWYIDIEKENIGYLMRENTPEEWGYALNLLNNDEGLAKKMSSNARLIFEAKCNFAITEKMIAMHINSLFENN